MDTTQLEIPTEARTNGERSAQAAILGTVLGSRLTLSLRRLLAAGLALFLILAVSWLFVRSIPTKTDTLFRRLQFVSASLYSLGHGGNDAQKTMGIIAVLLALVPVVAISPILLYIGMLIGAQAFQTTPVKHAPAVVLALTPHLAAWAKLQIDGGLLAKIDKSRIPNYKNLDPAVQAQLAPLTQAMPDLALQRLLGNLVDSLRHRARITQPMVRAGWLDRGPGGDTRRGAEPFVPLDWARATALLARELRAGQLGHDRRVVGALAQEHEQRVARADVDRRRLDELARLAHRLEFVTEFGE
mgnify:CR=1 FL=1